MTGLVWFTVGAVSIGPFFGALLWALLAPLVRQNAFRVCQEQALLLHGSRRVDEPNVPVVDRHRSPDHQMVTRPLRSSVVRPYEPR